MFEIHEHHPLLDVRLVDEPETGTDNLTIAIATTGWLAATMIHDFRNPLGTIRSASEILLDGDVNAAQLKRLARNMHHAATCMQELLTDLTESLRGNLAPPEIGSLREIILAASKNSPRCSGVRGCAGRTSSTLEAILHPARFRKFAAQFV